MAIKTYDESSVSYDEIDVTYEGNNIIAKLVSDTISTVDNISKDIGKNVSDVISILDAGVKNWTRTLVDSVSSTEVFSKAVVISRTFIDNISTSEILKRYKNGSLIIWKTLSKITSSFTNKVKSSSIWTNLTK